MRQRIITALIGIPIVLGILALPTAAPLGVLVALVAILGLRELGSMVGSSAAVGVWGVVWSVLVGLSAWDSSRLPDRAAAIPAACFLVAICWPICAFSSTKSLARRVLLPFWIVAPLASVIWLHSAQSGSVPLANLATLLMVTLWAGDSAAIFAGRAIGGPKVAPQISPKKTWSGSIANFITCVAFGSMAGAIMSLPVIHGLVIGGLIGVFGQAGDLFQSQIKREHGVKDSGTLLPGHGGILDRIDSLLFAAPVVCLYAQFFHLR